MNQTEQIKLMPAKFVKWEEQVEAFEDINACYLYGSQRLIIEANSFLSLLRRNNLLNIQYFSQSIIKWTVQRKFRIFIITGKFLKVSTRSQKKLKTFFYQCLICFFFEVSLSQWK